MLLLLLSTSASAQDAATSFDIAAANETLDSIIERLADEDLDGTYLNEAGGRAIRIGNDAADCVSAASDEQSRLETLFEPFREPDPDTATSEFMEQRAEIQAQLEAATTTRAVCSGIVDKASQAQSLVTARQNELSQKFMTSRSKSVFELVREFPARAADWPGRLKALYQLPLIENLRPAQLVWMLIAAALIAGFGGFVARQSFGNWYQRGGGDDAAPQFRYLLPKPLAEYAPLWLTATAIAVILQAAIRGAADEVLLLRVAWAAVAYAAGAVIISWATGPLSPSASVDGLTPERVRGLRRRLKLFVLALCLSYVVLGSDWLAVRVAEPYVAGRASMIFLVAASILVILTYLRRIPGLRARLRLLRWIAIAATLACIVALLAGYQNFAAFLVHGIARTGIALFVLWLLLWLVYMGFEYLMGHESPAADRARASLGITHTGTGTALGFMRLVADLALWISFGVFMIYVWDDSGTILSRLNNYVVNGITIGRDFQLVPINLFAGLLVFIALLIVIGWMKRWIDRRWLQHIVVERGARDAVVTLFGYVGFIIAVVIALMMADVDLTGLALISGALALGIGFGMQEIANNFVSGLILLFERPIRAGDFVTVGEVEGFVRSIRIRATEIETLDNQNVLVPNSELISGRVTNWVLRDTHGRLVLTIGVAYGSDVEKVREILESVSREHPEVITDGRAPAPKALFMEFGDSALIFELRVRIQRIERRFAVKSDLNFAIDKAFAEAGITIPFPQRDIHIVSQPESKPD